MTANKPLYMTSVDLEEVHEMSSEGQRAGLRIEQWLVHLVQFIYKDVRNREEIDSGVDVYHGSARV